MAHWFRAHRRYLTMLGLGIALTFTLAACGSSGDASTNQTSMDQLAARVTQLEQQVADLEAAVVASTPTGTETATGKPTDGTTSGASAQGEGAAMGGAASSGEAVVTAAILNVRSEPDASALRVGQFKQGTKVAILEEKNGWTHVRLTDGSKTVEGWVASQYLEGN